MADPIVQKIVEKLYGSDDDADPHGIPRPPTKLVIEIEIADLGRDRSGPWTHICDGRTQYVLRQHGVDLALLNYEKEVTHLSVRTSAVVAALNAVDRFLEMPGVTDG